MTMYPGPIVRTATKDDPNFDPKKDQVVINMHSGGEMVVERSEVGPDAPKPKPVAPVHK